MFGLFIAWWLYFCSFIRWLILPRDSGSSGHLCLVGGAGAKPRAYLVPFLVSWGHRRISPLGYTLPLPPPSTTTGSCSSGHPLISCRRHYLPLSIFPSSHPTAACGGKLEAAFRGQPGLLDLLLSASHLRQASALVACTGPAVVCGRGKAQPSGPVCSAFPPWASVLHCFLLPRVSHVFTISFSGPPTFSFFRQCTDLGFRKSSQQCVSPSV